MWMKIIERARLAPSAAPAFLAAVALLAAAALAGRQEPGTGGSASGGQSCVTSGCHTEYEGLKHPHGPVVLGRCLDCHEYDEEDSTPYESGDDHWFDVVERDGRLCLQCHEALDHERFVHYPLRRFICLSCHDPHGSNEPGMVRKERMADNCYECHERKMDNDAFVHAPVRVGACTVCHDPHGSPNDLALVVPGSELCLRCHVAIGEKLNTAKYAHRPVVENCALCHQPHDGPYPFLLRDEVPGLCLGCHEDMAAHIEGAEQKHGALDQERS